VQSARTEVTVERFHESTEHGAPARRHDDGAAAPTPAPSPFDGFDEMPIGEIWRAGSSGTLSVDRDPYSGDTLVEIPLADAGDVDEACREAERLQPAWAAVRPPQRRNLMLRAAFVLEQRRDEVLNWLVKESGSALPKAMLEWQFAHLGLLEAAGLPMHMEGRVLPSSIAGKDNLVFRRPAGVVGVISPWNFPLHLSIRSVAPALALGNCVVLKPASDTPVTGGLLIAKIFESAGLPPGVLNVVVGHGSEIGDAFIDHPVPRVLSFTGSTPVGRHIAEHAGRGVKRVCLELGGNCPYIVFDDADMDRAIDAAVAGKFLHQGQICIAVNRLLVQSGCHDEFVRRFVERARSLKCGDPNDPATAIGPIINRSQLESIVDKVERTVSAGARVLLRTLPSGLVLPPIVLGDVRNDMPAAREELFGPVAPIVRFDGEGEAIRLANDTEYGLSSAVFTRDLERAMRVARHLDVGMTHVNDWPVNDESNTAFGGEKQSGLGRFGGEWALEAFTSDHWVSVQERRRHYPI
jgi:aldehyde dehydrogenase (NAD+)